ncbi:hypothetical protein [Neochlamydia sp. TUME1]|uniref:hypothetical protein n=1 Tax=Neochlamydia sp. TUME1 TaxID=1478174 RepID=UPI0012BADEEF|nr:hypothetical protein [Neochlamydia sp. TUME1]
MVTPLYHKYPTHLIHSSSFDKSSSPTFIVTLPIIGVHSFISRTQDKLDKEELEQTQSQEIFSPPLQTRPPSPPKTTTPATTLSIVKLPPIPTPPEPTTRYPFPHLT